LLGILLNGCSLLLQPTYLRAVDSASRSSRVRLSPEDRKLSAREHGRGRRVLLASSVWSQLRGARSLQNVASSVALPASVAVTSTLLPPLPPPLMTAGYLVSLSFPVTGSLLRSHTARRQDHAMWPLHKCF